MASRRPAKQEQPENTAKKGQVKGLDLYCIVSLQYSFLNKKQNSVAFKL